MIDLHPDDIPVLTDKQMKEPQLTIHFRGWTFHYNYGHLLRVDPT